MKRKFNDLSAYIRLHDGYNKPRIDFQAMYKLFPQFEFIGRDGFGRYENFGGAFECKKYPMEITDGVDSIYLTYHEYQDAPENLAYIS